MSGIDVRQIAAIALAVAIMVWWFVTLPEPGERTPDGIDAPRQEAARAPGREGPLTREVGPDVLPPSGEREAPAPRPPDAPVTQPAPEAVAYVIENPDVRLHVDSRGARLVGLELLHYDDRVGAGARPVDLVTTGARGTAILHVQEESLNGAESTPHETLADGSRRVRFRLEKNGVELVRELELDETGYGGWLRTTLLNRSDHTIRPRLELALYGQERPPDAPDRFVNYSVAASVDGEVERLGIAGIQSPGFFGSLFGRGGTANGEDLPSPVEWVALDSQYFMVAAIPEDPAKALGYMGPIGPNAGATSVRYPPFEIPPGHKLERVYRLYLGPKLRQAVIAVDPRLDPALQVGWSFVRPLVNLFEVALVWTHAHVVANYGVAIILLTLLLRLATYPLTQRSMKSMKRFSLIAPEMKALQEKYADDREKLQTEMMSLYKRRGMNPLTAMGGGCLPMLIQMPFLLALYFALQGSIELRHAPFALWIDDLSAPENFLSIFGVPIRPLPLMMGGSMLLQQWLTPSTADAQQKQMMMWMSVIFTFMFYQFPSGLVLYWFVSNLLGILQQVLVNRSEQPATG